MPRILVVDDNVNLRQVVTKYLIGAGYGVLEAGDGESALKIIEQGPPVDLLFTDTYLPGRLSGVDLARLAKALCPDLDVVYTRGFGSGEMPRPEALLGPVLERPWQLEELGAAIARVLEA